MSRGLALFDFDGTITRQDSLAEFIIYTQGLRAYLAGILVLSPVLVLFKLKIFPRQRAKEMLFSYFFKGIRISDFQASCREFSAGRIPVTLRKKAMARIKDHQSKGDRIVVVTASPENWIQEWAKAHQLEYIATRLEVVNGILTGKMVGENCQGQEKVRRVQQYLQLKDHDPIYTYGDTPGDWPLIHLGQHQHYRPFRG